MLLFVEFHKHGQVVRWEPVLRSSVDDLMTFDLPVLTKQDVVDASTWRDLTKAVPCTQWAVV